MCPKKQDRQTLRREASEQDYSTSEKARGESINVRNNDVIENENEKQERLYILQTFVAAVCFTCAITLNSAAYLFHHYSWILVLSTTQSIIVFSPSSKLSVKHHAAAATITKGLRPIDA